MLTISRRECARISSAALHKLSGDKDGVGEDRALSLSLSPPLSSSPLTSSLTLRALCLTRAHFDWQDVI